VKLDLDLER